MQLALSPAVAAVALALCACHRVEESDQAPDAGRSKRRKTPAPTASSSVAPAPRGLIKLSGEAPRSVAKERPPASSGDPAADYTSFDQVIKAGDAAVGKTVLFKGYGTPLRPDGANLRECQSSTSSDQLMKARFAAPLKPFMRAMPSSRLGSSCPRVHAKVTGFDDFFKWPQAEVLAIYDLEPDPAPTDLPPGVDYASIDDLFLAGDAAIGKVAEFAVYVAQKESKEGVFYNTLYATGCSPHGGWNANLHVRQDELNRVFLDYMVEGASGKCVRVRARITKGPTDVHYTTFEAELLGAGDAFDKPSPWPNP